MGDSTNNALNNLQIKQELSTLVNQKAISQQIADKIGNKLIEKNVKINREQLNLLVKKIMTAIKTKKFPTSSDNNMQRLVETLDKLEQRISKLETGKINFGKTYTSENVGYATTDDINVPGTQEWDMTPLTTIPHDPESIIVVMKWLQYLIDKCGLTNLPQVFDYYVDIGWISEEAKINLLDYSNGIIEEKTTEQTIKKVYSNLPSRDHIQSFLFIQRIKGYKFDKHFIDRIDSEINQITKKLDNYHFK